MTFFDPCDPYVTFGPMLVTWHVAVKVYVVVTKYGQNPSRHVGVISQKLWQKERKKKHVKYKTLPKVRQGNHLHGQWYLTQVEKDCNTSTL